MKIKAGYKMRTIDGEHLVVATGDAADLGAMITVNDTGAFLWNLLTEDTTREALLAALLAEYEVDEATAAVDLDAFLDAIAQKGILDA